MNEVWWGWDVGPEKICIEDRMMVHSGRQVKFECIVIDNLKDLEWANILGLQLFGWSIGLGSNRDMFSAQEYHVTSSKGRWVMVLVSKYFCLS